MLPFFELNYSESNELGVKLTFFLTIFSTKYQKTVEMEVNLVNFGDGAIF